MISSMPVSRWRSPGAPALAGSCREAGVAEAGGLHQGICSFYQNLFLPRDLDLGGAGDILGNAASLTQQEHSPGASFSVSDTSLFSPAGGCSSWAGLWSAKPLFLPLLITIVASLIEQIVLSCRKHVSSPYYRWRNRDTDQFSGLGTIWVLYSNIVKSLDYYLKYRASVSP